MKLIRHVVKVDKIEYLPQPFFDYPKSVSTDIDVSADHNIQQDC